MFVSLFSERCLTPICFRRGGGSGGDKDPWDGGWEGGGGECVEGLYLILGYGPNRHPKDPQIWIHYSSYRSRQVIPRTITRTAVISIAEQCYPRQQSIFLVSLVV